jgi:hypothetical protein
MITMILILFLTASAPDAKELAQKGYTTFREVIAGDEAKLPDAGVAVRMVIQCFKLISGAIKPPR